ncbi:MAG: Uma2 family endonuclease [Acidobacteria bacterium]|nr:Uma2 family endonuclease [Acidobacteriota bacterium]
MTAQLARYPFTVHEYHRLREAHIFQEDDRIELIDGEIIKMAPIGPRHAACVNRLAEFLRDKTRKAALVTVQNPIELDDYSEPQPDIALVKRRTDFYASGHPTPDDTLVAIEVADTTTDSDRQIKLPSYARAGIQEAWLVDLPNDRIEIHSNPASGIYQEVRIVLRGQKVISPAFPNLKLKADDVLG